MSHPEREALSVNECCQLVQAGSVGPDLLRHDAGAADRWWRERGDERDERDEGALCPQGVVRGDPENGSVDDRVDPTGTNARMAVRRGRLRSAVPLAWTGRSDSPTTP
jgi:hypothetical protein